MDPQQYRELREAFDRLAQLPEAARRAELDRAFPAGHPLRAELESLLNTVSTANPTRTEAPTIAAGDMPTQLLRPKLAAGDTIGNRYKLIRLLGAGGFSQAFLAEDSQLHGKQVVIKIPLAEPSHTGEWFVRHFTDEIRALSALNHPNIVEVLDSGIDDTHGEYFTEQFIDGPALSKLLRDNTGKLSMDRCVRMLERIANALAAAHAKGIIHRDLKPQNIQVRMAGTRQETPVLIDFGIASLLGPEGDNALTTRVAGTPDYLAPEQAMGKVLPQSDLYAYGCIVIELLTGEKLHARLIRSAANATPQTTARQLLDEKVPDAPVEVREALARLVTVNPAERGAASDYAALFHAWPRQEQSMPPPSPPSQVTIAPPEPPPPPPPPPQSRRGLIIAAGATVLGAGALLWTRAPRQPRLRLTIKATRNNATSGIAALSPRDGTVTRNDKLRLQVTAAPPAFCYVFGASMASSIEPAAELALLFPPRPLQQPLTTLTVPSTANDWIEFDNKPEILRFLFIASLQPLPEADQAVSAGAQNKGVIRDAPAREALESRLRQQGANPVQWQQGEAESWFAESTAAVLIIEGRLQHLAV